MAYDATYSLLGFLTLKLGLPGLGLFCSPFLVFVGGLSPSNLALSNVDGLALLFCLVLEGLSIFVNDCLSGYLPVVNLLRLSLLSGSC